jgi:hypothetical protein
MRTPKMTKYLVFALVLGIGFSSCRKKNDDDDKDTSATADNALAEGSYNDVNNIADEASKGSLTSYLSTGSSDEKAYLNSCATVTNDSVSVPHMLTIDFGTVNCMCNDGRNRRGKINVSYSGHYRDSASTHTISFTNYFVNDNQIMGTKTVTNNGHNAAGHLTFTITVNGSILKTTGQTISWTSNRTREWITGESTPAWLDDVYLVTGSASGTSAAGVSFNAVITSALRIELSCHHIVSGSFSLTPSGKATRYFDFGTGACDNQATVTINGHLYNITLG